MIASYDKMFSIYIFMKKIENEMDKGKRYKSPPGPF